MGPTPVITTLRLVKTTHLELNFCYVFFYTSKYFLNWKDFFNFPHICSGKYQTIFYITLLCSCQSTNNAEAVSAML
ncbi:hypothetical protein EVA_14006 [gut metagenome]|uniref:Uncharacterized protein n=1 Tax=gut metagenome TaxID=749906 RepID=J9GEV5_9ZZZZ